MRAEEVAARLRAARAHVRWDPARASFVHVATNRALAGITARLRARFWPRYSARAAGRALPRAPAVARPRGAGRGGMARGRRVDREARFLSSKNAQRIVFHLNARRTQVSAAVNRGEAARHPYARSALRALRDAGFQPLAAQVPVGAPELRLATAVDVVALRNGRLELLELKAGWDDGARYAAACGRMRGAARALDDSPRNQHQLQLLVTRYLFAATFGVRARAAVVRVSADGVRFERLRPDVLALEAAVVAAVAARS